MSLPPLSLLDTRILGVLAEKQRTVPDTYPLSLNALVSGCNQKSSRDPVIETNEADVTAAIDNLRTLSLVIESSGGRVARYGHNVDRVLQIPVQSLAILTVLMLRGPQTAGELRLNCERLHRFSDISAVEGFLNELAARSAGALVVELPRQPGSRENRWAHLLSGEPDLQAFNRPRASEAVVDTALDSRLAALEEEVSTLKALVLRLSKELGLEAPES